MTNTFKKISLDPEIKKEASSSPPQVAPDISSKGSIENQTISKTTPATKITSSPNMSKPKPNPTKSILSSLAIVLAGTLTGYLIFKTTAPAGQAQITTSTSVAKDEVKVGDVIGDSDEAAFPDDAEGVLVLGGKDGEGSHHLLREGGPSRSVYLTSSVIDLDKFEGHLVKVWGETFAAQKVGWLMDVGRLQVVTLNAEKPFEEAAPSPTTQLDE